MGTAIAFDTYAYVKRLREVGVPEQRLATKDDLQALGANLRRDLKEMEMRILIRLGSLLVIAVGVVATLVKLL